MKINNDTTRLFTLEKKSTMITDITFQLGDHNFKKVDKYKYLGVYLMNILIIKQLQIVQCDLNILK